jgi:hemolysin activation/secretion protein
MRISEGMKLFGATTSGNSATTPRQGEQTGFSKINFETSRTQTLFAPWEGATVGLMELLAGQSSPNILPPAEQFHLGGARLTCGYYAGLVLGDKALAATVERQLSTSFETTVLKRRSTSRPSIICDWGETWQNLSTHHNAMDQFRRWRHARPGQPVRRSRFRGT